jgi:hypothetical protein
MVNTGIVGRAVTLRTLIPNNYAPVEAMELKTENDNRSKASNGPYWRSAATYGAIFNEESALVVKDDTITVRVTLGKRDGVPEIVLASAVNYQIPTWTGGIANDNPSAILAIKEWLVDRIKTMVIPDTSTMALYPWVHPELVTADVNGSYVFTFRIELPTSKRAALESEIDSDENLGQVVLSASNHTNVSDLFSTIEVAVISDILDLTTLFTHALNFEHVSNSRFFKDVADASSNDDDTPHKFSPLMRLQASGGVLPTHDRTVVGANSQPWAVATILQTNSQNQQTIFSYADGPPSNGSSGIWLLVDSGTTFTLKVGSMDGSFLELVYTDDDGLVPNQGNWVGLVLTWNGYADANMNAAQAASSYGLKLVSVISGGVTELPWTGRYMQGASNGYNPVFGTGAGNFRYAIGASKGEVNTFTGLMASQVCTTLMADADMPTDYELAMMVLNPHGWLQSYKKGKPYRDPGSPLTYSSFPLSNTQGYSTQVWLMKNTSDGVVSQDGVTPDTTLAETYGFSVYNVATGEGPTTPVSVGFLAFEAVGGHSDVFCSLSDENNPLASSVVFCALPTTCVELQTAGDFVILSKTGITNVPTSSITGDVGSSPVAADAMTGWALTADLSGSTEFARSTQVVGKIFAGDMTGPTPAKLALAILDMKAVYADAAARPVTSAAHLNIDDGAIGGGNFTAGTYRWESLVRINSDITITGGPNDQFVFQTTGDLIFGSGARVVLAGGAKACNIVWQVAGYVDVGTTAHLEGIFLVATYAAFKAGSSLNGRVLAQTAVTLISTTITEPDPVSGTDPVIEDWFIEYNNISQSLRFSGGAGDVGMGNTIGTTFTLAEFGKMFVDTSSTGSNPGGRLEIFAATSSMPGWEGGSITVKHTSVGLDLVGSSPSINQGVIYLSIDAIAPSPAMFNRPVVRFKYSVIGDENMYDTQWSKFPTDVIDVWSDIIQFYRIPEPDPVSGTDPVLDTPDWWFEYDGALRSLRFNGAEQLITVGQDQQIDTTFGLSTISNLTADDFGGSKLVFEPLNSMPGWPDGKIALKHTEHGLELVGSGPSNTGTIYLTVLASPGNTAEVGYVITYSAIGAPDDVETQVNNETNVWRFYRGRDFDDFEF